MKKLKLVAGVVWCALASKEARGPEMALLRIVVAALAAKLGWNLATDATP